MSATPSYHVLASPVSDIVGANPNAGQTDPPPPPGQLAPTVSMPQGKNRVVYPTQIRCGLLTAKTLVETVHK